MSNRLNNNNNNQEWNEELPKGKRARAYHDSGNKKGEGSKNYTAPVTQQTKKKVEKEPPPGELLPLWASAPVKGKEHY